MLKKENQHSRGGNSQNKNNLKVEKTNHANNVKDLETKIKKMQTELSEANRKSAENIKEINDVFISSLICRAQKRLNDKMVTVC